MPVIWRKEIKRWLGRCYAAAAAAMDDTAYLSVAVCGLLPPSATHLLADWPTDAVLVVLHRATWRGRIGTGWPSIPSIPSFPAGIQLSSHSCSLVVGPCLSLSLCIRPNLLSSSHRSNTYHKFDRLDCPPQPRSPPSLPPDRPTVCLSVCLSVVLHLAPLDRPLSV